MNILVREYRCSSGTGTDNPMVGGSSANIRFYLYISESVIGVDDFAFKWRGMDSQRTMLVGKTQ